MQLAGRVPTAGGPEAQLAARHSTVFGANTLLGQAVELPVHVSAGSHTPADGLHTTPALPAGCWHALLEPLHWSRVQGRPSLVQATPLPLTESAGQAVELPVQVSARSQSPVAARQVLPALPAVALQLPLLQRPTSHGLPGFGSVQVVPFALTGLLQVPDAPHTPALWHSESGVHTLTLQHRPLVQKPVLQSLLSVQFSPFGKVYLTLSVGRKLACSRERNTFMPVAAAVLLSTQPRLTIVPFTQP